MILIKWFRQSDIQVVKDFNDTVALPNNFKILEYDTNQKLDESLMMIDIWKSKLSKSLLKSNSVDLVEVSKDIKIINMELAGLYTIADSNKTIMGKSKESITKNLNVMIMLVRNKYGITGGTFPEDVLLLLTKDLGIDSLLLKYNDLFNVLGICSKKPNINQMSYFIDNIKKLVDLVDIEFDLKYDIQTLTDLVYKVEQSNIYRLKRASKYVS